MKTQPDVRHAGVPWMMALVLMAAALGGAIPAHAAQGIGDQAGAIATGTGKKVEAMSKAAGNTMGEVWRRIDEKRLSHRTWDEIVAWVIMGLLVGGLIHRFSKLNRVATMLLGLSGAFLGGIIGNLTRFDIGMGPVLIRYEELVASLAGGLLIVLAARLLASRRARKR